jgi:hypothetical protein
MTTIQLKVVEKEGAKNAKSPFEEDVLRICQVL